MSKPKPRQANWPSRVVFFHGVSYETRQTDQSQEGTHRLRCGFARAGRIEAGENGRIKECKFQEGLDFGQWLEGCLSPYGVTWVIAHALGFQVRLLDLFGLVDTGQFLVHPPRSNRGCRRIQRAETARGDPLFILGDPPTLLKLWTPSGRKLIFADLRNWLNTSLHEMAESCGLDYSPISPGKTDDGPYYEEAMQGVAVVERAFLDYLAWCKSRRHGRFMMTISGQSHHVWKTRYKPDGMRRTHDSYVKSLERSCLYGGRIQALYCGSSNGPGSVDVGGTLPPSEAGPLQQAGPFYHIDVTGMYPSLMRRFKFPVEWIESSDSAVFPFIKEPEDALAIAAHVLLDTDVETYPVRHGKRTLFARGRFHTYLAGPELKRAVSRGHVRSWLGYVRYRLDDVFSAFVQDHWQVRLAAKRVNNRLWDGTAKRLMNSLWGKLAQKTPLWVEADNPGFGDDYCERVVHNIDTGESVTYRAIAGVWQRRVDQEDHPDSFPAIAAWVTAHGREMLNELCETAGRYHVYYVGVDALIVDQAGYDNLLVEGRIGGSDLGSLRVLSETHEVNFRGLNRYEVEGVRHYSGLRRDALELTPGVFVQDKYGGLAPGLIAGEKDQVTVRRVVTDCTRPIFNGHVANDGWAEPPKLYELPF